MKWLFKAVMNSPPTLTLLLDLTHTTCFLALFPDIFPGAEPPMSHQELASHAAMMVMMRPSRRGIAQRLQRFRSSQIATALQAGIALWQGTPRPGTRGAARLSGPWTGAPPQLP
jgi:hypothetical protein